MVMHRQYFRSMPQLLVEKKTKQGELIKLQRHVVSQTVRHTHTHTVVIMFILLTWPLMVFLGALLSAASPDAASLPFLLPAASDDEAKS